MTQYWLGINYNDEYGRSYSVVGIFPSKKEALTATKGSSFWGSDGKAERISFYKTAGAYLGTRKRKIKRAVQREAKP